jgi:predicted nucleic acid-binding protein
VRVFLDSVLVIYLIDQNPVFGPRVEARLTANPCDLVSSELVRMESLIRPVRLNDPAKVAEFESFFATRVAEMVSITRPIFDRGVQIRAAYPFKTPDALHLAAAIESGCDVFLTNDHRVKQFTGLTVEVL